jgi:hypothetical protein
MAVALCSLLWARQRVLGQRLREAGQQLSQLAREPEMRQLLAELEAHLDRAEQSLDARERATRELLAEADDRLARLGRHLAAAGEAPQSGSRHTSQRATVMALHAKGLEATEIARFTGIDTGEVELLVNLSRGQTQPQPTHSET